MDRSTFDGVYSREITGKSFVEDLKYYELSRERYWEAIKLFDGFFGDKEGLRVLDIGGGQFAVLLSHLFGCSAMAADLTEEARQDVLKSGVDFGKIDLFKRARDFDEKFDCICLLEVIEHIPIPPYLVFKYLKNMLNEGGCIFMTTPNGHRVRNLIRLAMGREVLDFYAYPDEGIPLGHQHEYTMKQMSLQIKHAGMAPEQLIYFDHKWPGASWKAKIGWAAVKPLGIIPWYRSGIAAVFR